MCLLKFSIHFNSLCDRMRLKEITIIFIQIVKIKTIYIFCIGELYLAPDFLVPPNSDYDAYHQYVDNYLPAESPVLYGLHLNAEIGKYI